MGFGKCTDMVVPQLVVGLRPSLPPLRMVISLPNGKNACLPRLVMSAFGQKQTCAPQKVMSALPPESGHVRCN